MFKQHHAFLLILLFCPQPLSADVVVDNSSIGFYNDQIGTLLNGTSNLFPTTGDPTIDPAPEPDLASANSILGSWLTSPNSLNANWTGPQLIPLNWTVGEENAIIYEFDAGAGYNDFLVEIGVDNGAFVWLDGTYLGGHLRSGTAILGELSLDVGNVSAGIHHLQILREDHGTTSGYTINVTATAVPEPSGTLLLAFAIGILGKRRRKNAR